MLNEREIFEAIATRISKITGVQLGEKQYSLVLSRLSKHLRNMGGITAQEYWDYLQENEDDEIPVLISLLTTHHTFFFREQVHFDYLKEQLPKILDKLKQEGRNTLHIWCAACSKGQEGYTIAMFLHYHLKQLGSSVKFKILFSDVDRASVEWAKNGVYANQELMKVPIQYRSNHWIRGKGQVADFSKAKDEIKSFCDYRTINLVELSSEKFQNKFDIVFCRNVFIYFTLQEIESISRNILANMHDNGLFIIGVSESLMGTKLAFDHLGRSIYARSSHEHLIESNNSDAQKVTLIDTKKNPVPSHKSPIRERQTTKPKTSASKPSHASQEKTVLTLQSSLVINPELRSMINKIDSYKSVGFDLISTVNEIIKKLDEKKPEILIIEPGMTKYIADIKKVYNKPILLLTTKQHSNTREGKISSALEQGVTDYLILSESQSSAHDLSSLETKLGKVYLATHLVPNENEAIPQQVEPDLDSEFVIAIGASTGGTEAISHVLKDLPQSHQIPPIVIVQHIPEVYSQQFAERLNRLCTFNVKEAESGDILKPGHAFVAPGNFQTQIVKKGGKLQLKVYEGEKVNGHRPSVDVMFNSLAEIAPSKMLGLILTGMGADGAKGLFHLKEAGAYTISQDQNSCVVYGMPKAAFEMGASSKVLPLDEIGSHIFSKIRFKAKK